MLKQTTDISRFSLSDLLYMVGGYVQQTTTNKSYALSSAAILSKYIPYQTL
ncbi:MAG: hypothetical protein ACI30A_05460 [Paludibacteraceae bacterium]